MSEDDLLTLEHRSALRVLEWYLDAEERAWFHALALARGEGLADAIILALRDYVEIRADTIYSGGESGDADSDAEVAWQKAYWAWREAKTAIEAVPFLGCTLEEAPSFTNGLHAAEAIGEVARQAGRDWEEREAALAIAHALAGILPQSTPEPAPEPSIAVEPEPDERAHVVSLTERKLSTWTPGISTFADARGGKKLIDLVEAEMLRLGEARVSEVARNLDDDQQSVSQALRQLMEAQSVIRVDRGRYRYMGPRQRSAEPEWEMPEGWTHCTRCDLATHNASGLCGFCQNEDARQDTA